MDIINSRSQIIERSDTYIITKYEGEFNFSYAKKKSILILMHYSNKKYYGRKRGKNVFSNYRNS